MRNNCGLIKIKRYMLQYITYTYNSRYCLSIGEAVVVEGKKTKMY